VREADSEIGRYTRNRRFSSYATQCIEAEEEVEDAPGSGEAIQADRDGQVVADALRKAAPAGNESREADAQAEEADASEQSGQAEDDADVAVRTVKKSFEVNAGRLSGTRFTENCGISIS